MVVVAEDVFREGTRHMLHTVHDAIDQQLIVFVIGIACAHRILVVVVNHVGVEQDIGIVGKLGGIVIL